MFLSSSRTSACMPRAIAAALSPDTPAPMTTTFAAYTPETPPSRTPRPPPARTRGYAPAARRPPAAAGRHEVGGPALRGDPAGHLRHRGEERQRAVGKLDRLVGDA